MKACFATAILVDWEYGWTTLSEGLVIVYKYHALRFHLSWSNSEVVRRLSRLCVIMYK
jgi:hypothetical protein